MAAVFTPTVRILLGLNKSSLDLPTPRIWFYCRGRCHRRGGDGPIIYRG
jgi:hypothetical protein